MEDLLVLVAQEGLGERLDAGFGGVHLANVVVRILEMLDLLVVSQILEEHLPISHPNLVE